MNKCNINGTTYFGTGGPKENSPQKPMVIQTAVDTPVELKPAVFPKCYRWVIVPPMNGYPQIRYVVPCECPQELNCNKDIVVGRSKSPPPPPPPRDAPGGPEDPQRTARKRFAETTTDEKSLKVVLRECNKNNEPKQMVKSAVLTKHHAVGTNNQDFLLKNYFADCTKRQEEHRQKAEKSLKMAGRKIGIGKKGTGRGRSSESESWSERDGAMESFGAKREIKKSDRNQHYGDNGRGKTGTHRRERSERRHRD